MEKIKSLYARVSNFIKRYGLKAAIIKSFQKIFPGGKPSERMKNSQNDPGYIPNVDSELILRYPGMRPLQLVTSAMRNPTINLVMGCVTEHNRDGGGAVPLLFCALLSNKFDVPLRIITRMARPQKRYFGEAIKKANLPFDKDIEFIFSDPAVKNELILINENDLFVTTSWWTTRSIIESYAKGKMIYLIAEDEQNFCSPGDELEACLEVLNDDEIDMIVKSEQLYNQLISEGFGYIGDNAQWFAFPTGDWEKSFAKVFSWLDKRDSIKCIK